MIRNEMVVDTSHFAGLGRLAKVDGDVLSAGIIEDVHVQKAKRSGFRHRARVRVDSLREARPFPWGSLA